MNYLYHSPFTTLAESDCSWNFSRSGGPGGQNVNKVETAAELRVSLESIHTTESVRERLREIGGSYLTESGDLLIKSRIHRTQRENREEALERLLSLIRRAEIPQKRRKATRPTRASKEDRIKSKRINAERKSNRRRIDF